MPGVPWKMNQLAVVRDPMKVAANLGLEVLLRRSHDVTSHDHHGNSRAGLLGSR